MAPEHDEVNEWLKRAGIVHDGDEVKRVVIDIDLNCIVKVYVEKKGSKKMINVKAPDFSGCEITVLEKPTEET